MHAQFHTALSLIDSGDVDGLRELLRQRPDLLTGRVDPGAICPYDGYFAEATLLHHTTGNPQRGPLPDNIVDVARVLLDAGAEVDAETRFGDWSWTALGLVASCGQTAISGRYASFIDLLLERGANIDIRNGIAMYGAVYHVVECNALREVTAYLAKNGATLDLAFASAVGDLAGIEQRLRQGDPRATHHTRRYRLNPGMPNVFDTISPIDEALVYAAAHARHDAIDLLLERGADINACVPFGYEGPAAIHVATWADWPDTVRYLIHKGADLNNRDPKHNTTPEVWAQHCNRPAVAKVLEEFA